MWLCIVVLRREGSVEGLWCLLDGARVGLRIVRIAGTIWCLLSSNTPLDTQVCIERFERRVYLSFVWVLWMWLMERYSLVAAIHAVIYRLDSLALQMVEADILD
jgi:hypothetical protein